MEWSCTFPKEYERDVSFKLAFIVDGSFAWEYTYGHYNHTFLLPADSKESSLKLKFDPESDRLLSGDGSSLIIDEWDSYRDLLGEHFSQSEFAYSEAMQLLQAGRINDAKVRYDAFKKSNPGGREIDDFDYKWADHLAKSDLNEALSYLDEKESQENNIYRKSHFAYLKGEVQERNGRQAEARREYKRVLRQYRPQVERGSGQNPQERPKPEHQDILNYARNALASSYLSSPHSDSSHIGYMMLKARLKHQERNEEKRYILKRMKDYGKFRDNQQIYREAVEQLKDLQGRAKNKHLALESAKQELQWGYPDRANEILDTLIYQIPGAGINKIDSTQTTNTTAPINREMSTEDAQTLLLRAEALGDEGYSEQGYLTWQLIPEKALKGLYRARYNKLKKRYEQLNKSEGI